MKVLRILALLAILSCLCSCATVKKHGHIAGRIAVKYLLWKHGDAQ